MNPGRQAILRGCLQEELDVLLGSKEAGEVILQEIPQGAVGGCVLSLTGCNRCHQSSANRYFDSFDPSKNQVSLPA